MKMEWENNKDICPKCNHETQIYIDVNGYNVAERCTACKWQINFVPKVQKVKYGTIPKPEPIEE